MTTINKLDRAERLILQLLQRDGRMSNVELADRIGLSESPTLRRVKRLEEAGVIAAYTARLDQRKLGLQVTAFVQVTLEKADAEKRREFIRDVEAEPHIVECHAMSGAHDYLMKVIASSMDQFSDLCMNRILRYPGVTGIESQFSLQETKPPRALPI